MQELLNKYKRTLADLIVMDDYDGGKAAMLAEVIEDMEKLDKPKLPDQQEVGVDY
jgi:hypothetical protein